MLGSSSIVYVYRFVQLGKYSTNSRCRPPSCLLAVFAMFLAIISPSSSCGSYSWNEWDVCHLFFFFFFTSKTTEPRSQVYSVTVPEPVAGCIFDVICSLNTTFFQGKISSSVTSSGELCVCIQSIRIGEIKWFDFPFNSSWFQISLNNWL